MRELSGSILCAVLALILNLYAEALPGTGRRTNKALSAFNPAFIPDIGWQLSRHVPGSGQLYAGVVSTVLIGIVVLVICIAALVHLPRSSYPWIIQGFAVLYCIRTVGVLLTYSPPVFPFELSGTGWLGKRPSYRYSLIPSGHTMLVTYSILLFAFFVRARHPFWALSAVSVVLPICLASIIWSHIHRTDAVFLSFVIVSLLTLVITSNRSQLIEATITCTCVAAATVALNVLVFRG